IGFPVLLQRRAPSGTLSALQLPLQNQLGDPASVEAFINKVLDASEGALARAHALRALARRFPPGVEAQLSSADRAGLAGVRRDHSLSTSSNGGDWIYN
ncbi:MAG: hypothetical protein M3Y27_06790, partial [Acidobacteriota bacterium]|nr:hypothetical protein [Acidobacteriota bacterium]